MPSTYLFSIPLVTAPLIVTSSIERVFSQDEVIRLASTPCSAPALKRAFLFSCITALRKSDIKKLTWEEIQPYGSDGVMYVTTRMQKTKDIVHNPISEEALELIGYSPEKHDNLSDLGTIMQRV